MIWGFPEILAKLSRGSSMHAQWINAGTTHANIEYRKLTLFRHFDLDGAGLAITALDLFRETLHFTAQDLPQNVLKARERLQDAGEYSQNTVYPVMIPDVADYY